MLSFTFQEKKCGTNARHYLVMVLGRRCESFVLGQNTGNYFHGNRQVVANDGGAIFFEIGGVSESQLKADSVWRADAWMSKEDCGAQDFCDVSGFDKWCWNEAGEGRECGGRNFETVPKWQKQFVTWAGDVLNADAVVAKQAKSLSITTSVFPPVFEAAWQCKVVGAGIGSSFGNVDEL